MKKVMCVGLSLMMALTVLTGCSSQSSSNEEYVVGTWTKVTGMAEYMAFGFGAGLPLSSADNVTLFSDGTYLWSSMTTLDYSTDGENYFAGLSVQNFVVHGTYSMEQDEDLEVYKLTILTVDRVVANGAGDDMRVELDTDKPNDDYTAEFLEEYKGYFQDILSQETYELDYWGKLSGTSLTYKTWYLYVMQQAEEAGAGTGE